MTQQATSDQETTVWQLTAITETLGDLTLMVTDTLSIGRGQDNNVVLGSKSISRNHAEINLINGQLYLKDLGSSNGTFINDTQLEPHKSKHVKIDDRIRFANLIFQASKDAQPPLVTQEPFTNDDNDVSSFDTQADDSSLNTEDTLKHNFDSVEVESRQSQLSDQVDSQPMATSQPDSDFNSPEQDIATDDFKAKDEPHQFTDNQAQSNRLEVPTVGNRLEQGSKSQSTQLNHPNKKSGSLWWVFLMVLVVILVVIVALTI